MFVSLDSFDDQPNRVREPAPLLEFRLQPRASSRRQRIELRAAIVLRILPLGLNPALVLQTMQSGVQRALLNLQHAFGDLHNALRYRPPVHRLQRKRLQNQQVKRAYLAFAFGSSLGRFCSSANSKPLRYASFTILAIFSKLIFSTVSVT